MSSNPESPSQAPSAGLNASDLDANPVVQFGRWFEQVLDARLPEPNAMTLATASPAGVPSARVVLLKAFDERGFVFFTNYRSQKGAELAENPQAALVFFWPTLERQVRVVGSVSKVTREESETYFHARPIGSQLGAWASKQSQVLRDRAELESRLRQFTALYGEGAVPLPAFWGGYRVRPSAIEFWQARVNRLHDRFRYTRVSETEWRIERLFP